VLKLHETLVRQVGDPAGECCCRSLLSQATVVDELGLRDSVRWWKSNFKLFSVADRPP
jgi:hypothetical protein